MICDRCFHSTVCKNEDYDLEECGEFISRDVVEVKHGKWVNPDWGYEDCSVCGYCFAVYDEHEYLIERNFCPNCGADMRERKESDVLH